MNVLVTSGYSNAEYAIEEPQSHTYFLAKPYSRRDLVEKIEEILAAVAAASRRAATQADQQPRVTRLQQTEHDLIAQILRS